MKKTVINRTSDHTSRTKASGADFTELISVPLSSDGPSAKRNSQIIVAVSTVGEKSERSNINDFIVDNDVHVLSLTETWLLPSGDEAECSDLSPLATGLSASLVLHVAMASPSFSPIRSLPFSPSPPTSAFTYSSFKLSQLTLSLPQLSLHISTVHLRTGKKN